MSMMYDMLVSHTAVREWANPYMYIQMAPPSKNLVVNYDLQAQLRCPDNNLYPQASIKMPTPQRNKNRASGKIRGS